jgi:hypothetical protein
MVTEQTTRKKIERFKQIGPESLLLPIFLICLFVCLRIDV